MLLRSALPLPLLVAAASCGYVGPVVPPSTEIPLAVSDLTVAERGDQLMIDFTTPPRTTDNLTIKRFELIDLRVTADVGPAHNYKLPVPTPQTSQEARIIPIHASLPVADWAGKRIEVRVRTGMRRDDSYSAWSNAVTLDVVAPLARPKLTVEPTAAGYRLSWPPSPPAVAHRILRLGPGMKAPVELATVQGDAFTDNTSQWGTPYAYTVVAMQCAAESVASDAVNVDAPDTFPPSTPADVTAVASPQGVEISWRRSPEPDVSGYDVYRAQAGGSYTRLAALVRLPVFTDATAEHGKSYSYKISALDASGNESARSAAADVDVP